MEVIDFLKVQHILINKKLYKLPNTNPHKRHSIIQLTGLGKPFVPVQI